MLPTSNYKDDIKRKDFTKDAHGRVATTEAFRGLFAHHADQETFFTNDGGFVCYHVRGACKRIQ